MKFYSKDMSTIGFKGSNIFESKWHHFYYRAVPEKKSVYIFDALDERVQHFSLTNEEWNRFNKGTLSLVPFGCCGAGCDSSRRKVIENPIIDFEGDTVKRFKTKSKFLKHLEELCNEEA